jgi:hypothetical protein
MLISDIVDLARNRLPRIENPPPLTENAMCR